MKKYSQRGFTLIELLVVIAIIGILSSVVLASLSTARNKGRRAAVQSQMKSFVSQATLLANDTGFGAVTNCTTGVLAGDTTITSLVAAITTSQVAPVCTADSATAATKVSIHVTATTDSPAICMSTSGKVTAGAGALGDC